MGAESVRWKWLRRPRSGTVRDCPLCPYAGERGSVRPRLLGGLPGFRRLVAQGGRHSSRAEGRMDEGRPQGRQSARHRPPQRGPQASSRVHRERRALKAKATKEEWDLVGDVTYHDLRHDFAHRARESGWHLEEIAYYLGHTTNRGTPAIQTTARYMQVSREQVKDKLKALRS